MRDKHISFAEYCLSTYQNPKLQPDAKGLNSFTFIGDEQTSTSDLIKLCKRLVNVIMLLNNIRFCFPRA